jgi:hypothetical protein
MIRKGMTVRVKGQPGVAFSVLRGSAAEGHAVVVMVGDDRRYTVPIEHCTQLKREEYCKICGQIGCIHDGRNQ